MLAKVFPFMNWFRNYDMTSLRFDALSGLTVALVLIPQSMAYAQLAGLPAYYGLYASFLPPMIAALFGSSRQLATGPVAVVSLMTSASLAPLATGGSPGYIAYAILLALMVGIFQLVLGVLRLGLVVNFLSHPVVNGFTNAAALIIASSQLSKMFGVYVDTAPHHYETIVQVIKAAVHYTYWPTLLMGVFAFAVMYGLKWLSPRIPNVLVAVVITTFISWATGFQHDQTVTIEAIESPAARNLIESFNEAASSLPSLSEERTHLSEALNTAKQNHNQIGVLDAEHDVNVVNLNIARKKAEAHESRQQLRYLLLAAVPQADGSLKFYPKDKTPAGMETDGRTWRIKVGNEPLDTQNLLMMGGGAVVGKIPQGLPALNVPPINLGIMLHLLPFAAIISLLGFMEAISIAKAMAGKTGQRLDPNQELIGQGLANICGCHRQELSDIRIVFALGSQSSGRGRYRIVERLHQPGGCDRAVVFHPVALSSASSRSGSGHHDGRHRPGKRYRLHPRLGGQMVRRCHLHHFVRQHPGVCPPSGQGDHDRGRALPDGLSVQEHAPQRGFLGQVRRRGLALCDDPRPAGMRIRVHGALRRSPLFRQRQLSGRQDNRNHAHQEKSQTYHYRCQWDQRHRCIR